MHHRFGALLIALTLGVGNVAAQEIEITIFNTGGCSISDGGQSETVSVFLNSCTDFGQPGALSYTDPGKNI
jgi:hypothetical protein